jgi:hypothetical protein
MEDCPDQWENFVQDFALPAITAQENIMIRFVQVHAHQERLVIGNCWDSRDASNSLVCETDRDILDL